MSRRLLLSLGFILTLILTLYLRTFLDPDFGWQFQTGRWIWQHRSIPHTDLFSYTMPQYPWHYPAWASEVLFSLLHQMGGYSTVALFIAAITAAALLMPLNQSSLKDAVIPLALGLTSILFLVSTRPKAFSLLFASFIFTCIHNSKILNYKSFILPLLFLVWSNLHGAFILPLTVLTFWRLLNHHFPLSLKIILLCWLATLINPFGIAVYTEIFTTISSVPLNALIQEWQPLPLSNPALLLYITFFAFLIYFQRVKIHFLVPLASFLLLLVSLPNRRLLEFFILFTLYPFAQLLSQTYKAKPQFFRARSAIIITVFFTCFLQASQVYRSAQNVSEANYYPQTAVAYLSQNLPQGNLFAPYNWGGYLIYRLPQKPVFIDGRMAIWEQGGFSAFQTERQLLSGQIDYRPLFGQFHITTVLLPNIKNQPTFADKLIQDGWQIIHQDSRAMVLSTPQNTP